MKRIIVHVLEKLGSVTPLYGHVNQLVSSVTVLREAIFNNVFLFFFTCPHFLEALPYLSRLLISSRDPFLCYFWSWGHIFSTISVL